MIWFAMRDERVVWGNVPPAPSIEFASSYGLGDHSFSYRINGLMIQNLGDTGGRVTSLKDYDYDRLTEWFFLQDSLDHKSSFIPYLASYYFIGLQEPEKYRPVLDYLEVAAGHGEGEKWRWLVQAVFFARFRLNDLDKALELAHSLADTKNDDVPGWVRQMPAFVMTQKGEKEAAYALMVEILKTSADKMHPNEVNAMKAYICDRILDAERAKTNSLCQN
ncbi:MAG: hypothetical protein ACRBDL_09810 [Alphaproteobacteria bacterium]